MGCFFGALMITVAMTIFPDRGVPYKQGQIDALNGKVFFELKKQEDGTTVWVRK